MSDEKTKLYREAAVSAIADDMRCLGYALAIFTIEYHLAGGVIDEVDAAAMLAIDPDQIRAVAKFLTAAAHATGEGELVARHLNAMRAKIKEQA